MRSIKRYFPWIIVLILGWYIWQHREEWIRQEEKKKAAITNTNAVILTQIEALGKLELVRYNFQEVTEVKELGKEYFKIFKVEPDSKAILITQGEAVGCLDLTKMDVQDLSVNGDTLYVKLPDPELCYYKLNMEKTRLYSVETGVFANRDQFIQRSYQRAEEEIKKAALNSNILDQTRNNAHLILKPMLEKITGKVIVIRETIPPTSIEATG